ncbi:MAG: GldG family protein [Krumholzibacteria bacterium]|nr:GldG family protein [Candidatus Krumholzibacteria bacterium]
MSANRRNFRLTFAAAAVLLTAACFLLIAVTGGLRGARLDLTDDGLFTMSPAAVTILQGLQVPVQVKLYITPQDKMPTQLRNLERDVTEQMRNFEQVSEGMIEFAVFNPQDDEAMQEALAAKGIQPFQVQSVDKDEIGVKLVWSAMTIAYKDKPEELLPRVLPGNLATLEQDLIGPVHRLTRERTPKVAVFGPRKDVDPQLAMMYLQQGMQPPAPAEQFARIRELLQQGHYEAVPVDISAESPIPDDVDLLIVMGMARLEERQVYEINRALRGGTPVVMAVQAHEYGYGPAQNGGWTVTAQGLDTGLEPLLAGFGVTVGEDHFLDEAMETIDLPREVNLGGLRMQTREPVRLPIQIRVTESQMQQDSPIVNRIGSLFYLWGTPVTVDREALAGHGLQATDLIHSSGRNWTAPWSEGPVAGAVFQPTGKAMTGPQPLAVLIEGTFPDTFADRVVPAWPAADAAGAEEPLPALGPEPGPVDPQPARLLVVGSAKMFDDNIIAAPQNALLLLNAIDYLAGSEELLDIRAKALTQRVIRPVSDREKLAWRIVVVFLVPVILTAYGLLRAAARRREATHYRETVRQAAGR